MQLKVARLKVIIALIPNFITIIIILCIMMVGHLLEVGELHAAVQVEEGLVGSSPRAASTLVEAPPSEQVMVMINMKCWLIKHL